MDTLLRCTLCRNVVDAEDLFCATCGREVEPTRPEAPTGEAGSPPKPRAPELEQGLLGFDCRGCGASMTYDASAKALRCAFCGSTDLGRQPGTTGRIRPTRRVAFALEAPQAHKAFAAWIRKGIWRPSRLKLEARVVEMQPVYVPCWVFAAETDTNWAADSSETPAFARASWCPVGGRSAGEVRDVLVLASGTLTPREIAGLLPFDLDRAVPYQREDVGSTAVEDVGVSRRGARPAARATIEDLERERCASFVPGRSRNVHVNVLVTGMTSEPVLLPVFIAAYRWRERSFRFLVNGETGAVIGSAPVSKTKVALAIFLAAAVIAAVVLLAMR
jgi:hypothetical protein